MARYTTVSLNPDVADEARRLAHRRNLPLSTYLGELVEADRKAVFGDDPAPVFFIDTAADGTIRRYIAMSKPNIDVPAELADDLAKSLADVTNGSGDHAICNPPAPFATVKRRGPAIIVEIGDERWSLGVEHARRLAVELARMIELHGPKAQAA